MERDPVCGMTVAPARAAATADHAGMAYYFCGNGCAAKFQAAPDKYLGAKAAVESHAPGEHLVQLGAAPASAIAASTPKAPASKAAAYTCPMDPEVRQDHPGPCPKCGMSLEPDVPVIATRVEYTCPMHPQIVRPGLGSCPICGMALE